MVAYCFHLGASRLHTRTGGETTRSVVVRFCSQMMTFYARFSLVTADGFPEPLKKDLKDTKLGKPSLGMVDPVGVTPFGTKSSADFQYR